jgi:hypothetical protein
LISISRVEEDCFIDVIEAYHGVDFSLGVTVGSICPCLEADFLPLEKFFNEVASAIVEGAWKDLVEGVSCGYRGDPYIDIDGCKPCIDRYVIER